jgi:CHAT domain-containing protein/tetratricopeptide (TPR) repeat protein
VSTRPRFDRFDCGPPGRPSARAAWLLAVLVAATLHAAADSTQSSSSQPVLPPVTALTDGATIRRSAALGDTHRYEVMLAAGDFLEISVSQDQVLVTLSFRGVDGAVLRTTNVPDITPLPERTMLIAPASGRYALEIYVAEASQAPPLTEPRPPGKSAGDTPRTYSLQVVALRPATSDDRTRARCFDILERAVALERLETMDGLQRAIPVYREAAAAWRAAGDVTFEVHTLQAFAMMTSMFTQFALESAAARERLAEIYVHVNDREAAVVNWQRLATEYVKVGRLAHAKQALNSAREPALALGWRTTTARIRQQLGYIEFELGNFDQARALSQEAHDLAVVIPARGIDAMATWNLSRLDALAGDLDSATARARRSVDLSKGDAFTAGLTTLWLGFLHIRRGELDEAASRLEARLMMRGNVQRDQEAMARLGLGDVMLARGDRQGARTRYQAAALALEKGAQQSRCMAEQRLARMDLEEGGLDQAATRFQTMLRIAVDRQNPLCEAEARAGLADVAVRRSDWEIADAEARRVVELTETFREAVVSLESRALGFGALAPAYERAIEISMQRAEWGEDGSLVRALALNEHALARGLLDRVLEERLDRRIQGPTAVATERNHVRERLRARLAELQIASRTHPDAPETQALIGETSALEVQVRDLEARIDAVDPRHATFVSSRPLDVDGIQALLDEDTLLLEYALGEARSYVWAVSRREIRAFTLAPRATIEALARRVHMNLARSPASTSPAANQADAREDARALTRMVIEPAASVLTGRRLVVVLPGALSLIPFGALPQPVDAAQGGPAVARTAPDASPMLLRYEIVQVPSATILGAMRSLTAGRAAPIKTAAIFADPIYEAQDPRVRPTASSAGPARAAQPGRVSDPALARLPFSRGEADAIAALAGKAVTTFVGEDATRERTLGRALYDYRFLHFAAHGIVNQKVSSLSSLVLSLVDEAGRSRDGFVMLQDVYDMTLNADVVVLSGCQTALGKDVRGEGPIGLARAFMFAGVPRVVASLWQVDDLATAELMKRFYRGMFVDGLPPAAALRAAQRELAATRRWRSPYFWAPFVLQGDWR